MIVQKLPLLKYGLVFQGKSQETIEFSLLYILVGGFSPIPLKNMTSSLGMMNSQLNGKIIHSVGLMKFPTEWKVIKFHGSKPPTRSPSYSHCCWFIPYYIITINITMFQTTNQYRIFLFILPLQETLVYSASQ